MAIGGIVGRIGFKLERLLCVAIGCVGLMGPKRWRAHGKDIGELKEAIVIELVRTASQLALLAAMICVAVGGSELYIRVNAERSVPFLAAGLLAVTGSLVGAFVTRGWIRKSTSSIVRDWYDIPDDE